MSDKRFDCKCEICSFCMIRKLAEHKEQKQRIVELERELAELKASNKVMYSTCA